MFYLHFLFLFDNQALNHKLAYKSVCRRTFKLCRWSIYI